jgi:hypothetical protein
VSDDQLPTTDDRPAFRRGVVRPVDCLSEGWRLIKDQYWLFLGITIVGVLLGSAVPFVNLFLIGPMMCGIYYCFFRHFRGRSVKFEMLFRGFDDFVQSLIATLIMIVPALVILVPAYVIFIVGMVSSLPKPAPGGPPPAPSGGFFVAFALFYLVVLIVVIVLQIFFFFTYPLITDRRLTGVQAVATSFRAASANFGGILGLVLLIFLLNMAGSLACCIGQFFVLPLHYAAVAVAYRQVFESTAPEPPPVADYGDPDVRPLPPERRPA